MNDAIKELKDGQQFKYCKRCKDKNKHRYYNITTNRNVYELNMCPECNSELSKIQLPADDCSVIRRYLTRAHTTSPIEWDDENNINTNNKFIEQMELLYNEDIIKYQENIYKFKQETDKWFQQRMDRIGIGDNTPKCPTCGSTNIQKISLTSKAVGAGLFGIFSSNVRNTFKCNSCGSKWG